MSTRPIHFALVDQAGDEHTYVLTLHHASEGVPVALRLMALLSGPAAQGLVALFSSEGLIDRLMTEGTGAVDVHELVGGALGGVTAGELSKALASALADPSAAKLVTKDLMVWVSRDSVELSSKKEFDKAFLGNYGELFRLVLEVVKHNRFLPWLRT